VGGGARLLLARAPAAAAARGPAGAGSVLGTTLALFAAILVPNNRARPLLVVLYYEPLLYHYSR
jgi:hypothetical protein